MRPLRFVFVLSGDVFVVGCPAASHDSVADQLPLNHNAALMMQTRN
jgi:hypothetical protein